MTQIADRKKKWLSDRSTYVCIQTKVKVVSSCYKISTKCFGIKENQLPFYVIHNDVNIEVSPQTDGCIERINITRKTRTDHR